ncbi:Bacterial regulatory protein, tetR family [compost metagenome]
MSTDQPTRRPGRPRNEQSNQAILQAARELIADHGVQSFSMEQLAARAGDSWIDTGL